MNRLSLKYRIAIIIFVLETIMVFLVLWQSQKVSFEATYAQHEAYEHVILNILGDQGRYALINEEYDEFQVFVEKVLMDPHVLTVVLTDFKNQVVASTNSELLGRTNLALKVRDQASIHALNLSNASGTLGRVAIEFTDSNLIEAYRQARIRGLSIAGTSMLFIAFIGILIGYFLTRRLNRLQQAVRRVAKGDLEIEIDNKGCDEVALLSQDFTIMATKIKVNIEELQNHRDNLEALVKERTKELNDSKQRLEDLIENLPTGVLIIDTASKKIISANPQILNMINTQSENIIGRIYTEFIIGTAQLINVENDNPEKEKPSTYKLLSFDGDEIPILRTAINTKISGQKVSILCLSDLSKHKEAEEEHIQREKLQSILEMAGAVCHEFNQPLMVISGYSELLLSNEIPENAEYYEYVNVIFDQVSRLGSMTNKIMNITQYKTKNYLKGKIVDIDGSVEKRDAKF